jgi:hypothetical protein
LGLSDSAFSKWVTIGKRKRLRELVDQLPPSFSSLYLIARLTDPELDELLASGKLNQHTCREALESWISEHCGDASEDEDSTTEDDSETGDGAKDEGGFGDENAPKDGESAENRPQTGDVAENEEQTEDEDHRQKDAPLAPDGHSDPEPASPAESARPDENGAPSRKYAATSAGDTKRREEPSPNSEPGPRVTLNLTLLLDHAFSPEEFAEFKEHLLAFPGVRGIRPDGDQRLAA